MEESLNSFQEYYDINIENVNKANICATNFPSSKLIEKIDVIIEYLNNLIKINSWQDSAKEAFDEGVTIIKTGLEELKDNISEYWNESEEIYKALPRCFDDLNDEISDFRTKLSNRIIKANYKKIDENNITTYPGYARALEIWESECNSRKRDCEDSISAIEEKIRKLKDINSIIVAIDKMSITNLNCISNSSNELVATYFNTNYYVVSTTGYDNLKKQSPDKCWHYAIDYAENLLGGSYSGRASLNCKTKEDLLQIAATEILAGRPCVIQVNGKGKRRHFVTVAGLKTNADLSNLQESDFLILDPASAGIKQLNVNAGGELVTRYLVSAKNVTYTNNKDNEYLIELFNNADDYLINQNVQTTVI